MASHYDRWSDGALQLKLGLVALVAGLLIWHTRRPRLHALEAVVFLVSLMIVWLGLTLAH
jgi:CHASE2 domain-containing sensor protein